MDELRRRRLKHNELLFRAINDERERSRRLGTGLTLTFLCECSDPNCTERIRMTSDSYLAIRERADRFILRPGHEEPLIENVVETRFGYEVVEKRAA